MLDLQDKVGLPFAELLALSYSADPFGTGTPADWEKARWVTDLAKELGLVGKTHQRGLHYALISHGVKKPDGSLYGATTDDRDAREDFGFLSHAVSKARELGLQERG